MDNLFIQFSTCAAKDPRCVVNRFCRTGPVPSSGYHELLSRPDRVDEGWLLHGMEMCGSISGWPTRSSRSFSSFDEGRSNQGRSAKLLLMKFFS